MHPEQAIIEHAFTQDEFDAFARLSGDDNPIHTDPEFAANTPFGHTVAHGLLLCSMLRGLVETLRPGSRVLEQSVMFPAPTYSGERMEFSARVIGTGTEQSSIELQVRHLESGAITCQGQCTVGP